MTLCIISCGVEGAEQGALLGANNCGLEVMGWILKGQRSKHVDFLGLPITKHEDHWIYAVKCLELSDGAAIFGSKDRHSRLVKLKCDKLKKFCIVITYEKSMVNRAFIIEQSRRLARWTRRNQISDLYVTGDTEQTNFGIAGFVECIIISMASVLRVWE